jgi:hypothetical protein
MVSGSMTLESVAVELIAVPSQATVAHLTQSD